MFAKWSINDSCNLSCPYCIANETHTKVLSFEDQCRVLDKFNELGVTVVDFFGKEPLLNDRIFKLYDYAKSKGYPFHFIFISNGVNLKQFTPDILAREFTSFTISYEGNRGGRNYTFDLNDLTPFVEQGVPVEISIDVHRKNKEEVVKLLPLLSEYGVSSVYLKPIVPVGELSLFIEDSFSITPSEYLSLIEEVYPMSFPFDVVFSVPFTFNNLLPKLPRALPSFYYYLDEVCHAGENRLFVSCDGEVFGCGASYYANAKGHSCDFLTTPLDDILSIIKSKGERLCLLK